jgi:hypothetical protein
MLFVGLAVLAILTGMPAMKFLPAWTVKDFAPEPIVSDVVLVACVLAAPTVLVAAVTADPRTSLGREQDHHDETLEWLQKTCKRGGHVVAAVLIKGDEVHAASIAPGKWLSRAVLRKSIGAIVDRYGVCRTAVMRDNAAGHAFVRRLGFEPVSHGEVTQYELRKPRHV